MAVVPAVAGVAVVVAAVLAVALAVAVAGVAVAAAVAAVAVSVAAAVAVAVALADFHMFAVWSMNTTENTQAHPRHTRACLEASVGGFRAS